MQSMFNMVVSRHVVFLMLASILHHGVMVVNAGGMCGGKASDIVFLLDSSASMWEHQFDKQVQFVKMVVNLLRVGPRARQFRVGVLTYNHEINVEFHLNEHLYKSGMKRAIDRIHYREGGGTYTGDAIQYAREEVFTLTRGARKSASPIMVIITDGYSQNKTATSYHAKLAKDNGIKMFAIGVGYGVDEGELTSIASEPTSQYMFRVNDFDRLESIKEVLALSTCEQEMQRDNPSHKDIKVSKAKDCRGKPAEVIFALDSSRSIWEPDFRKQITFVKELIESFDISPTSTRVGIFTFNDNLHPLVTLDSQYSKADLLEALDQLPFQIGETDTAAALSYIRERGFHPDIIRPLVPKVAIILTDGKSKDMVETAEEAYLAKKQGIYLFAIGIGASADRDELTRIATKGKGSMFMVDNYDALVSIRYILSVKACQVIRADHKSMPSAVKPCSGSRPADIMFALDSLHLGEHKTMTILNFITMLSIHMNIHDDIIHVGVTSGVCASIKDISFRGYQRTNAFIDGVNQQQTSALDGILRKIRRQAFSTENGGRYDVAKKLVIFLDGSENIHRRTQLEAQRLRFKGIEITVVLVGNSFHRSEVEKLTSYPSADHLLEVVNFNQLEDHTEEVLKATCSGL